MATSLGEGLGLQSGRRSDYWMGRLASEGQQREAARKKEEDDLIKLADFEIDYGKYLPMYGKAIAQEAQGALNEMAQLRQNGGLTRGKMQEMTLRRKQRIGELELSNKQWLDHMNQQGILKNPEAIKTVTSTDASFEDLKKFNDNKFYRIGDKGEFSWTGVPDKNIPVVYDKNIDYTETYLPKTEQIADQRIFTKRREISGNAIEREKNALMGNPNWIDQQMFSNPQLMSLPPEQQIIELDKLATKRAASEAPIGWEEKEMRKIDTPSGSGSSESERRTPTVVKSQGAIMIDVPTATRDKDGKQVETSEPAQQQAGSYDYIVNIGDTKPVTVTVTSEMVKLNPQLKGIKSINVKPTTIYRVRTPEGYGLMTRGVVQSMEDSQGIQTQFGEEGSSGKITKSFEPIFPYDAVQSEVERTYPNKMKKIYTDLEIGKKPTKSGSTIIVTVDGKRGEISADQWEAFKKKYPNAKKQ